MQGIRITPLVRVLLIINVSAFVLQLLADSFFGFHLLEFFALVPYDFLHKFSFWQLFTYMFMHADLFHILFNMLILWMIGSELEAQWGTRFFAKFYFICGMSAGVFYLAVQAIFQNRTAMQLPMVGSSGAVYGLLVAYGIIYSERVMLFMMVFPMKAKHFVMVLAGVEFVSTVFYTKSGVANAAHLGGMATGFGFLYLKAYLKLRKKYKNDPRNQSRKRVNQSHLRLVVNNEVLREFDTDEDDSQDGNPTNH